MEKEKKIYVFADFLSFSNELVGTMYVSQTRGKEFYSFEYNEKWLEHKKMLLDPDLQLYKGRQYITDDKNIFGVFADSCPDRWGRRLMKRREEIRAKREGVKPEKLLESDYLLGVYDEARMGGLRFKTELDGNFLSDDKEFATPPWTSLRELEQASIAFENDSVMAQDGSLWIAKFPSKHDDFNSGAWEMVAHELAAMFELNVPEAKIERFSKLGTTFLVKRFDRKGSQRVHFSSAMTMLGKKDGADMADGSSYFEIVSFLKANGVRPQADLVELWKRIVLSMAVSNTDDHFRNHGFILSEDGWELSPLYDVNPDIYGEYLSLNVDSYNADISFDLAIESAKYYGLDKDEAVRLVALIKDIVRNNWQNLAKKYGIGRSEIDRMKVAFRACED